MAISVARVHLAMANAALPGLLPTPPMSKMIMPLLPAPRHLILPAKSPSMSKPSRADADERWDAHKTKPSSPSSSSSSGHRSPGRGPGRASSCDRWDSNKKSPSSTSSTTSSNQLRDSGGGAPASRAPSGEKWDSSKRRPVSRGSSAERWDVHKKPRPLEAEKLDGGGGAAGSGIKEMEKPQEAIYAGPGFLASPEPWMLPIPTFMCLISSTAAAASISLRFDKPARELLDVISMASGSSTHVAFLSPAGGVAPTDSDFVVELKANR
ncbi:hypothetical protein ACP70R_020044 [Stipagrostis hirtigluma subsp. patula]